MFSLGPNKINHINMYTVHEISDCFFVVFVDMNVGVPSLVSYVFE